MGWQERRYDNHEETTGGRFRKALRRIFVEGDDFYSWSVKLFRVFGIEVRIHLFYIVMIVGFMVWPVRRDTWGYAFSAFSMATLFLFVLLHEFGHCFACRKVGGNADRILMWPLGGLAFCQPPHNWKADLITVLGGPLVNLVLIPILGASLLAAGAGWGAVIYNPFDVKLVWAQPWFSFDAAYWKYFLWSAYQTNLALFAFNMLLVMYPMDAGRILQTLLWRKLGYRKSMLIATNVGLVMAITIGVFALFAGSNTLFAIAFFCGISSYSQRARVAMLDDDTYDLGTPATFGYGPRTSPPARSAKPDRAFDAARRRQEVVLKEQAEEDRILEKIAKTGMQSLSRLERKSLEEATRRKREAQGRSDVTARGD